MKSRATSEPDRPARLSFRVPAEGWYWLAAAAAVVGLGLLKSINLLTLLGCLMLALWAVNAVLAGGPLRRLRGRRWLEGPVFAGAPAAVAVELTNDGWRGLAGLRLEDGPTGHSLTWTVPRLAGRQTVRLHDAVVLATRGVYPWGPLRAASAAPFDLALRRVTLAAEERLVVLPRLGQVHRGKLRGFLPPAALSVGRSRFYPRRHPTAQAEFHGLRAFRSGDSPRWIHWRTSARCNELMVREFEDVPANNLILVLDPCGMRNAECGMRKESKEGSASAPPSSSSSIPHSAFPIPHWEEAISLAATICWEWCRQHGDRLVLAVAGAAPAVLDGVTSREHALRLLECLALLPGGPAERGAGQEAVLDGLARMSLPPAPVLLVSVGPSTLGPELGRRLRRPVACVDVADLSGVDFYEKPPGPAA